MVNSPDALGNDPCTVTGIRAINEPGEGLVELEITVGCSRASPWKDYPVEHPWFREFHMRDRRRRARCVPDRPVNAGDPRSLTDTFTRLLTCAWTGPSIAAYVLLSNGSRVRVAVGSLKAR